MGNWKALVIISWVAACFPLVIGRYRNRADNYLATQSVWFCLSAEFVNSSIRRAHRVSSRVWSTERCLFVMCGMYLLLPTISATAQDNPALPEGIERLNPELETKGLEGSSSELARANLLYSQGKFQSALELYSLAIKTNPNDAEAFNGRAATYKALNQLDQAVADFSQAIRLSPTSATFLTNRGVVFKTQQLYDKAISDFNRALELDPRYALAYYCRGNLFGQQNNLKRAIEDLTRAVELDPQNPKPLDSRGFANALEGRDQQAIADFDRALALDNTLHGCLNRRGLSYLKLAQYAQALADFERALVLAPGNAEYERNRAQAAAGMPSQTVAASPDGTPAESPEHDMANSSSSVSSGLSSASPVGRSEAISRGAAIASAQIGLSGGKVEVPGKLSLDFPAGALADTQKVTVFSAETALVDSQFYFVEIGSGQSALKKSVTVRLKVSAGSKKDELVAMQEVGGGLWSALPFDYDEASGELQAQVIHFSGLGWSKFYKWMVGTGAMAVGQIIAFSGAALLGVVTLPATVGVGMTVAVVGTIAVAGAIISDPLNAAYQKWGLERYAEFDQFTIMWTEKGPSALPEVEPNGLRGVALTNKQTNHPEYWVMTNSLQTIDELKKTYSQHNVLTVPPSILALAYELATARVYYAKAGYQPRAGMTVLVHRNFKSNWGSQDAGEWDHDFLHINTAMLEHREQEESARRATIAHEYWHAISEQHGFDKSGYPWMEEAFATAFENEVFPGANTFLSLHDWPNVVPELRLGLVLPIQADAKRGYDLWPWGKYVLRGEGHQAARDLLSGKQKDDYIAALFVRFVRSLLFSEHALGDPVDQEPSLQEGKPALKLTTGWSDLKMPTFAQRAHLKLGANQLPDILRQPRPMSFNLFFLDLNSVLNGDDAQEKSDLVVRRVKPATSEQLMTLERISSQKNSWNSIEETESGKGAVLVRRAWLKEHAHGKDPVINVALVGAKEDIEKDTSENQRLLAYFLRPPRRVTVEWRKNSAGVVEAAEVKWEEVLPAPGLKSEECYSGFLLKVRVGAEEWESGLIAPNTTSQTVSVADLFPMNRPMPNDIVAQTTLGIAAQDAAVKLDDQKFAISETTWQEKTQSKQEMTLLYCGSAEHSSGKRPPEGEFDCTRWQPVVAGWGERKLGITEVEVLRPCVYSPPNGGVDLGTQPVLPPIELPPGVTQAPAAAPPKAQESWQNFAIYNTTLSFDASGKIDQIVVPTSQNVHSGQDLRGNLHFTGSVTREVIQLTVVYPDGQQESGATIPGGAMSFTYDRAQPPPAPADAKPSGPDLTIFYPPVM